MNAKIIQTHEVRRSFPSAQNYRRGDLVDAADWRNRALLERQGYIVPIEEGEKPKKTEQSKTDKKDIKNDGDGKTAKAEKTDIADAPEAETTAIPNGDAEADTVIEFEIADKLAAELEIPVEAKPAVKSPVKKSVKK